MRLEDLQTYEILEKREIPDIGSVAYRMRHKKTGARVALVSNSDENKVFYIGFRTPSMNSTGVAHIMEHSVLCGSEEFPVKDPFVELVKGSLNTFLNAMTYPDKTVYPVASCNDKDFQNLMHVYLDAVFHPNIYRNESIFRQEGWHYEEDPETGELSINGVVYNEMKGAFSSPDDVLYRNMMNALYPDMIYGYESGGDPEVIPELSYEAFLDFHRRFYHPSNSYIYLYGDMDMAEKLVFLDEHYLSHYDYLEVDSEIPEQKPFESTRRREVEYPVTEDEEEAGKAYLSLNYSVGDSLDRERYLMMLIVDYALCSAPGAPLKQALVDRGIGKDVYSIYDNGIRQPFFSIVSKFADLEQEQDFVDCVREVLTEIVEKGFDKKALRAGIHCFEFKYREADFGSHPKGLMYGLQMFDSWLYDDEQPFLHIAALDTFEALKKRVDEGAFEEFVRKYLLENPHSSVLVLKPKKGLAGEREEKLRRKLQERKAAMSEAELAAVREIKEKLDVFQESEDSREDLAKIPLLTRKDLKRECRRVYNEERKIGDLPLLYHNIPTNGIGYLNLVFRADEIPGEYFHYLGFLVDFLGLLSTEHYSYGDLCNEVNLCTGGITTNCDQTYPTARPEEILVYVDVRGKAMYPELQKTVELMQEIMLTSRFDDKKRLKELLSEQKSQMQARMISAGHRVAANRALSYGSRRGVIDETLSGISYYRLLCEYEEHFEERAEELIEKLTTLVKLVFRKENLMVDFTGEEQALTLLSEALKPLTEALFAEPVEKGTYESEPVKKNEGFMTSGQVQYVCRAGNFRRAGLPYTGALRVLRVLEGYEYLWMNVRVKGGAYGCMCSFSRSGDSYFVSYRDPNLGKTIEVFEKAAEAVANFEADERTMTQYIIGAISEMDVPLTPALLGGVSMNAYLMELTEEERQRERDEVLDATPEDIRALSEYIRAFLRDDQLCVVGSSSKIAESKNIFGTTENLF